MPEPAGPESSSPNSCRRRRRRAARSSARRSCRCRSSRPCARPPRRTCGPRSTASRPARPPRRRTTGSGSCCAAACPACASCSASSSWNAVPEPSSLMPGPAGTESRWAPASTLWFGVAALGLGDDVRVEPLLLDADRLQVDLRVLAALGEVVELLADGVAGEHGRDRRSPDRAERKSAAVRPARVALVEEDHADGARRRRRAASFCDEGAVPRWISAIAPSIAAG